MGFGEHLSHLDGKIRPGLAKILSPDSFVASYSLARDPMINLLAKERPITYASLFPVEFGGLTFRNDLGNAAGYDKDGKLLPLNYLMGAGFAVVGTVLNAPNDGNQLNSLMKANPWTPLPASHGAINSLGLPSKGVDDVVKNIDKFRSEYQPVDFPVGASIMGHPKQEGEAKLQGTVECLRLLLPYVDFVEINESCPNVHHDEDGEALECRLGAIMSTRDSYRSETGRKVPLLVKLGSFGNANHTVNFMTNMEIDGLVGVNTQKNYEELRDYVAESDLKIFDHYTSTHKGGVSGEPIRHFAYQEISKASEAIKDQGSPIKLIHVGGIGRPADIKKSRNIGKPVILREWYTGMMEAMANQSFEKVYQNILEGEN